MGLINWLKRKIIARKLKQFSEKTPVERSLDSYVVESMKRNAEMQRTADKFLKAKILDKQTQATLRKLQELDDDEEFDDDEDDEEQEPSIEDNLKNALVNKLIGSFTGTTKNPPLSSDILNSPTANEIKKTMSPEQKALIKKKFGIDL